MSDSPRFVPPVAEVSRVTRCFGKLTALDSVTLGIPPGVVFGLIGGNGAGKTTLIRHLLGLLKPNEGQVRVFGLDPAAEPVAVLSRVGYLSEDRDLPDWMRVDELLSNTRAFFRNWDTAYAEELRQAFELDRRARVRSLSRGQRARAGLLLALAHKPELLILDEPSSGLDPVVRRDILAAIIRTIADEGRTVVFSSHLLDEVERVADKVALLHAGKIVLEGSLEEIASAHCRLTVRFEEPRLEPAPLAGSLACSGSLHEWSYVCAADAGQAQSAAAATGGRVVEVASVSLEEIFISRVNGRGPMSTPRTEKSAVRL
jgi:ABC-2 type transport system ATP-binding protein